MKQSTAVIYLRPINFALFDQSILRFSLVTSLHILLSTIAVAALAGDLEYVRIGSSYYSDHDSNR